MVIKIVKPKKYKEIVGRSEAAGILGIEPVTLDYYVKRNYIPHFYLATTTKGRKPQVRFYRKELYQWIEDRKEG